MIISNIQNSVPMTPQHIRNQTRRNCQHLIWTGLLFSFSFCLIRFTAYLLSQLVANSAHALTVSIRSRLSRIHTVRNIRPIAANSGVQRNSFFKNQPSLRLYRLRQRIGAEPWRGYFPGSSVGNA